MHREQEGNVAVTVRKGRCLSSFLQYLDFKNSPSFVMKRHKHSYMLMINDMMAVERTLSAKRQLVNLISTQIDPFWVRGVPKLRARVVHVYVQSRTVR